MRLSISHLPKSLLLLAFFLNTIHSAFLDDVEALAAIINETLTEPDQAIPAFYLTLEPFVGGRTFFGNWVSQDGNPPIYFRHGEGFSNIRFSPPLMHLQNMTHKDHFSVRFFDGEHIDDNFIMLVLPRKRPTPVIDWQNMTVTSNNLSALILQSNRGFLECPLDLTLKVKDTETGQPLDIAASNPESDKVGIQILMNSTACGIGMETTVMTLYDPMMMEQIGSYSIMVLFAGFINILAYVCLYFGIKRTPSLIFDVSIPTLNFFTIFDVYVALDNLNSSVIYPVASVKILLKGIGIFYIATIVSLSLIFMLTVKRKIAELPWQEVSRKMMEVRVGSFPFILMSLILAFVGVFVGIREKYFITFSICLLPQILQNAHINRKYRWNYWYMGAMFLPKVIYFYYMEGYNYNLFRRSPHTVLCNSILIALGIQIVVLAVQTHYPRLVPRGPVPYKVLNLSHCTTQNCPICLQDFDKDVSISLDVVKPEDGRQYFERQIVVTPCNHEFHMKCLKDWFTCKFECPYCRNVLPFSMEFEDQHQMA